MPCGRCRRPAGAGLRGGPDRGGHSRLHRAGNRGLLVGATSSEIAAARSGATTVKRIALILGSMLLLASAAFADIPRPLPPPPPQSPLPPPPSPATVIDPTLIAGAAATAGLVLGGLWLARRPHLRVEVQE